MLSSALDRAMPFRALELTRRSVKARAGGRDVLLPVGPPTRRLLDWSPNWKTQLLRNLLTDRDGVLVDVGANVGQTLLDYLATGSGEGYVGFEPLPECAAFVQQVIDLNQLDDCTIVPVALAETPGVLPIHIPDGDHTSATLRAGLRPGRATRTVVISCQPLASAWSTVGAGRSIAAVKIDVEGAELEALAGMASTLKEHALPPVLCEVLDADDRADMSEHDRRLTLIEDLVSGLGYRIERVVKDGAQFADLQAVPSLPRRRWTPTTAEECDYLFVSNP